jgi:hypothetical protein
VGGILIKLGAAGIVVLMIFFAMMLWIGIPLGWLYIGSQVASSTQPSAGPYMLVAVGIVVSVIVDALILSRLNRVYQRVTGSQGEVRIQFAWLRSLRGERTSRRPTTVLDIVMIGTVAVAAVAAGVWFLLFAGSPLPGGG